MPVGKIKVGRAGSLDKLKKELKSNSQGDKWFYRIPADEEVTVRFMVDPPDFVNYMNHYDPDNQTSYPCNTGDCIGCDEGIEARKVWVAPAVDVEENKVLAMVVPKGIVDSLTKKYERARSGTITDRDFIIMREGSGKDNTKYDLDSEMPRKRDLSDFEVPDIESMLEKQLLDAMGVEEDDDDEPPRRKKSSSKKPVKKTAAKKRPRPTIADEDDEDDDDEEEDWSSRRPVKKAAKKSARPAKTTTRKPKRGLSR